MQRIVARRRKLILSGFLTIGMAVAVPAAAAGEPTVTDLPAAIVLPDNVQLVQTVMQRRALHRLNSTTGVRLPRIRIYTRSGELLLYVVGWERNVPERIETALQRNRPLAGATLSAVLSELSVSDGSTPTVEQLPPADVVVVTSWSGWCRPCATAIGSLRDLMAADLQHSYVWITVETDAVKQKLILNGTRSDR